MVQTDRHMKNYHTISRISVALCMALLISCSPVSNKKLEEMIEINENWTFSEKAKSNGWMLPSPVVYIPT